MVKVDIDRKEVRSRARAIWDAQPELELAYGDFGAFLQARTLEAIERGAELAFLADASRTQQKQQHAEAAARLAAVRSPLYALSANKVEVVGRRLVAWLYGRFGEEDGEGQFTDGSLARAIDANPDATSLVLRISSSGGFLETLDRMTAALRRFTGKTVAIIDSAASSAAAYFALACDQVVMRRGSTLMLHRIHCARNGNCAELRAAADDLERADERLMAALFERRPQVDRASVLAAIERASYLTADQALAIGLIDEITRPLPFFEKANA